MRHILQLVIAVICGLAAFGMNYLYLTAKTAPTKYARVKTEIRPGDLITRANLEEVPIGGDISLSAVPFKEVGTFYNRQAPRKMQKGELLLWQDLVPEAVALQLHPGESGLHIATEGLRIERGLLRIGDMVGFVIPRTFSASNPAASSGNDPRVAEEYEQIGPFRVVGINNKVGEDPYATDQAESDDGPVQTITVAVELKADKRGFPDDANRLVAANAQEVIAGVTLNMPPRTSKTADTDLPE